jgi:hypothetical protein
MKKRSRKIKYFWKIVRASEGDFFGSSIKEISENPDLCYNEDGSLNVEWIEANVGKYLAKGSTRMAFDMGDYVIKFAYPKDKEEGKGSNFLEYKLFNQYPFMFPRGYMIDPNDNLWFISEKVKVIKEEKEFDEQLRKTFPVLEEIRNVLVEKQLELQREQNKIMNSSEEIDPYEYYSKIEKIDNAIEDIVYLSYKEPYRKIFDIILNSFYFDNKSSENSFYFKFVKTFGIPEYIANEVWELINKDSNLMSWAGTIKKLNIDPLEVGVRNVGQSLKDERLVILDVSIMGDKNKKIKEKILVDGVGSL